MRPKILVFIELIVFILVGTISNAQVVCSYEEAEQYGENMLKQLKQDNVAHPMQYKVMKRWRSFKRQVRNPLTIYEINTNYNLRGKTIEIPDNSVLVFNGGSLKNGKITGHNVKYCIKNESQNSLKCNVDESIEKIGYLVKASSVGMIKDDESKANDNYKILKSIIDQGNNLFLDGAYYVTFSEPIELNRVFSLYGGKLIFRKSAFSYTEGGGLDVKGTSISISEQSQNSFFCGSKGLLGAISIKLISFIHCKINCQYLVNIRFEDINSDEISFGVNTVEVNHCVFDETGRVRIVDAVIADKCSFTNNYYQKFTIPPIYISRHHDAKSAPNDASAYSYVSNNLRNSCPIVVNHNIFIGTMVSLDSYYCTALLKSIDCYFTNNYIQDIINTSDGSSATAYDAYLSCTNVYYENNFVKDVMSFSINNSNKPQCQIGKSKTSPLASAAFPSKRIFKKNVFLVDGDRFLKLGADTTSLYTDIFRNFSYIYDYVWEGNSLIYKNAKLDTGWASRGYESFQLLNNYFEIEGMFGRGLITIRSDEPANQVIIQGNTFKVGESQYLPLFNQRFEKNYNRKNLKNLVITDNVFTNATPMAFFFTGENIIIKNNISEGGDIVDDICLSGLSGGTAVLDVEHLDAELKYKNCNQTTGGLVQCFSSKSNGTYSIESDQIPDKGISYYYNLDDDDDCCVSLTITRNDSIREICIPYHYKDGVLQYEWNGEKIDVSNKQSTTKLWYDDDGIQLKTNFYPTKKKRIQTIVIPQDSSSIVNSYKFSYKSKL